MNRVRLSHNGNPSPETGALISRTIQLIVSENPNNAILSKDPQTRSPKEKDDRGKASVRAEAADRPHLEGESCGN